jgi:hypothetical protein
MGPCYSYVEGFHMGVIAGGLEGVADVWSGKEKCVRVSYELLFVLELRPSDALRSIWMLGYPFLCGEFEHRLISSSAMFRTL